MAKLLVTIEDTGGAEIEIDGSVGDASVLLSVAVSGTINAFVANNVPKDKAISIVLAAVSAGLTNSKKKNERRTNYES